LVSGSVGAARDISWVKRFGLIPGNPLRTTVKTILAMGISVRIEPSATSVLTKASFAAGAPRVINANTETKTAYETKKMNE
jgi:hypothetical protein